MPLGTTLAISAAAVAGLAAVGWPLATWLQVATLEKPKYEVVSVVNSSARGVLDRGHTVEVRRYAPYLVARVVIEEPSLREALPAGFRKIASFIFGENEKQGGGSDKISMTVPVQTTESEKVSMTSPVTAEGKDGKYEVTFGMPSKYTKATLPRPKDPDVKIEEVPSQTFGVISWRGGRRPDEELMAEKRQQLVADLRHAGVSFDDAAPSQLWQYYPPFAPNAIKLVDLLLPVDASSLQSSGSSTAKKSA